MKKTKKPSKKLKTVVITYKDFTFKLAGRLWEVTFVDPGDQNSGECDKGLAIIKVDPKQCNYEIRKTILHELFHAFNRNILQHDGTVDEEISVESAAEGMLEIMPTILKECPWLFTEEDYV